MGFFDWILGEEVAGKTDDVPLAATPKSAEIESALLKAEKMVIEAAAPTPVIARTLRITNSVRQILPILDEVGMASTQAYTVVATATDYLPESLKSYLSLPRQWADSRPVADGKSSLMMLIDQLDLLGLTVEKMIDATNRRDASSLIAQGMFLSDKFAPAPIGLQLPQVPAAPVRPKNPLELD